MEFQMESCLQALLQFYIHFHTKSLDLRNKYFPQMIDILPIPDNDRLHTNKSIFGNFKS